MPNHNKTILLVEDNPNDEELTRLAFSRNNITNPLVVAHDGVEALDYLFGAGRFQGRDITEKPQVIILDLKLPRVDGLQVLERIRTDDRTAFIPVVILTSSKEEEDMLRAYQLGTNAYVRKPVDFIQFTDAVKQLGLFWLLLNEAPTCCRPCSGTVI
jgi:two-component system response regulator